MKQKDIIDCLPDKEGTARWREIKSQIWFRLSDSLGNQFPKTPGVEQAQSPVIPSAFLPEIKDRLVVDVVLLKGKIIAGIVVNARGAIIGSEDSDRGDFSNIPVNFIYGVRVRSGVFGRLGLTRWRTICEQGSHTTSQERL